MTNFRFQVCQKEKAHFLEKHDFLSENNAQTDFFSARENDWKKGQDLPSDLEELRTKLSKIFGCFGWYCSRSWSESRQRRDGIVAVERW